jgi:hypothetical protein
MNKTHTLESVQAAFQLWRQNKTRLRARTPDELRQQALSLRDHHSPSEICKALGITRGMFRAWQGHAAPEPIEFVTLPTETDAEQVIAAPLTLELTQTNGNHWRLHGDPSAAQLGALVSVLVGRAP